MSLTGKRATTCAAYAMDKNYDVVVKKAKNIHRHDGEFYVVKIMSSYSSVSKLDMQLYKYEGDIDHYVFDNGRWRKVA